MYVENAHVKRILRLHWWSSGQDVAFQSRGMGSSPGQGARIPHASWPKYQNTEQKQCGNKISKDFKNDIRQKNLKKKKNPVPVRCQLMNIAYVSYFKTCQISKAEFITTVPVSITTALSSQITDSGNMLWSFVSQALGLASLTCNL